MALGGGWRWVGEGGERERETVEEGGRGHSDYPACSTLIMPSAGFVKPIAHTRVSCAVRSKGEAVVS